MFKLPSRSEDRKESGRLKRPPNYLARRQQWRILMLVGMFMAVLILMAEARKPENWYWLWGGQPPSDRTDEPTEAELARRNVDTRFRPRFEADDADSMGVIVTQAVHVDDEEPFEQDNGLFPGVRVSFLNTVEDDTLLRGAEHDAWFHLLAVLAEADQKQLDAASIGRVGFLQLYEQPSEYRGQLVTIRGTIVQARLLEATNNDRGIESYYKCILRPVGNANSPIFVYALQLPPGFPVAEEIEEETELTGFSYKRLAYQAVGPTGTGQTRTAPLVLAKTVHWTPKAPEAGSASDGPSAVLLTVTVLGTVLAAAAIAIGLCAFVYFRSLKVSTIPEQYSRFAQARPDRLAELQELELPPETDFQQTDSQQTDSQTMGDTE